MSPFQQAKLALVNMTDLAKDALHIHVSLIVFFGACLLFRWKAWQLKPWLLVLLAALTGEVLDLRDQFTTGAPLFWGESIKDFTNTAMVPTVIMLTARFTGLFGKD